MAKTENKPTTGPAREDLFDKNNQPSSRRREAQVQAHERNEYFSRSLPLSYQLKLIAIRKRQAPERSVKILKIARDLENIGL